MFNLFKREIKGVELIEQTLVEFETAIRNLNIGRSQVEEIVCANETVIANLQTTNAGLRIRAQQAENVENNLRKLLGE